MEERDVDKILTTLAVIDGLRDSVWKYVNEVEQSIQGLERGEIKKATVASVLENTLNLLSLAFPREVAIIKPIAGTVFDILIEEAVAFGNEHVWDVETDFLNSGFAEVDSDDLNNFTEWEDNTATGENPDIDLTNDGGVAP